MEIMTKTQTVKTPRPPGKRRMYRGIIMAQALCDVFVRASSEVQADKMIEAGKGLRKKARFGKWELWQEAIAVDTYMTSEIPSQEIPQPGLTERELGQIYMAVQHNISIIRGMGFYTDKTQQAMADAVREFHNMLKTAIRAKVVQTCP
jgi:hypothetical protein